MSAFFIVILTLAIILALLIYLWDNHESFTEDREASEVEDARVAPLLRGINYLLSDNPNQALQEMVKVAKDRSESVEVYMALGEMFRAQGEYGRAVRIHQNLLARPGVSEEFHFQAYVSLGRDFQAGGLLDRALRHYGKALTIKSDHLESLHACLRIREQSHEWAEAEWLVSRLEQIEDVSYGEHRAYLKAEMAKTALDIEDLATCKKFRGEALRLSSACTHAHLLQIERAIADSQYGKALDRVSLFLKQVKIEHHALLPKVLMASPMFYQQHAESLLLKYWHHHYEIDMGITWVEHVAKLQGLSAAKILQKQLKLHDLKLCHELRLLALDAKDSNLVQQAKAWRLAMKHYACKHCGVQVHTMRWQCPKCNKWGTMEPWHTAQAFGEEEHV